MFKEFVINIPVISLLLLFSFILFFAIQFILDFIESKYKKMFIKDYEEDINKLEKDMIKKLNEALPGTGEFRLFDVTLDEDEEKN